jgi:hypothetical protein
VVAKAAFADGMRASRVMPVFKHFPGLGHVTANTDTAADVVDTTVTADGPDVAVYRRLQGGPAAVMVSSAIYQNIDPSAPAVFSPTVVGLARSLVGPERDDRHRRPPRHRRCRRGAPTARCSAPSAGVDVVLASTDPSVFAAMYDAVLAKAQADPRSRSVWTTPHDTCARRQGRALTTAAAPRDRRRRGAWQTRGMTSPAALTEAVPAGASADAAYDGFVAGRPGAGSRCTPRRTRPSSSSSRGQRHPVDPDGHRQVARRDRRARGVPRRGRPLVLHRPDQGAREREVLRARRDLRRRERRHGHRRLVGEPGCAIVCCTAEILANIALRQGRIDQVVMDEFHFYGDPERGWAWQVPLLLLPVRSSCSCRPRSATSRRSPPTSSAAPAPVALVTGVERPCRCTSPTSDGPCTRC